MVFWPWKKKEPEATEKTVPRILVDLADLIPGLTEGKSLPYNGDEKEESSVCPCPTEHRSFKVCTCMDCPKRDTCAVEADLRSGDCRLRFARVCSVKSGGKPTGFEKIIVDIIVNEAMKKISESESNWTYKKAKEKEKEHEGKESESTGI